MIYSKSQTLITGTYRTGSEYLAQLINCNPEISVTMYRINVLRFVYNRFNPIWDQRQYKRALESVNERVLQRYKLQLDLDIILKEFSKYERITYGIFYDIIMNTLYINGDILHWAEKNQLLWREIPIFLDIMPNGKAIHIIRDPRAVLLSFKKYTYAPPPAYLGAIFNCYDSMKHALYYSKELPKDRYLSLTYEELINDTEEVVNRIWRFLGLSEGHRIDNQDNWLDAYGKPWHVNSSFHSNDDLRPYDVNDALTRWQRELSDSEIQFTDAICKDVMKDFGYSPFFELDKYDWHSIMKLFINDETILSYYKKWLLTGKGIEAFPLNPLDPTTWER